MGLRRIEVVVRTDLQFSNEEGCVLLPVDDLDGLVHWLQDRTRDSRSGPWIPSVPGLKQLGWDSTVARFSDILGQELTLQGWLDLSWRGGLVSGILSTGRSWC